MKKQLFPTPQRNRYLSVISKRNLAKQPHWLSSTLNMMMFWPAEKDAYKAFGEQKGDRYFEGMVNVGQSFKAVANAKSFNSKTYIHFYDDNEVQDGVEMLQSVVYQIGSSEPMHIGDTIGNAQLIEYWGDNGAFQGAIISPAPTLS